MAKKITLFILALALALMLIDDDLSAQSKALLETADQQQQSNAYLFLLGIMAAPEDDPIVVGKALYNSIKAGEQQYLHENKPLRFTDYPANKKLPLPQGDMFCSGWEQGCHQKRFAAAANYTGDEHQLLQQRYLTFLSMDDYRTLNEPILDAPLPPYAYLTKAFRSMLLENIHQAENGNTQQAASQLLAHIATLRRALAKADTLIGKIIFATHVSETIDTIVILCQRGDCSEPAALAPLTASEMSMELPLKTEFRFSYNSLIHLDKNFFSEKTETPKILRPFSKIIFKVNMTANMQAIAFTKLIETSRLKPVEFVGAIANNKSKPPSSPRNIAGSALANIGAADYDIYSARLQDLNIKIALLNSTIGKNDIANLTIFNPYYGELQKLDFNNGMLCLKGPLVDIRNMRCVPDSDRGSRSQ